MLPSSPLLLPRARITLHGGRIEVESQVGVGTSFTVILPATRVLPAPETPHPSTLAETAPA